MTTFTAPAAEVARIVRAVEKSAAKDPSRPALAGIHVTLESGKLTTAAADGFRLSTAHTTLAEADDAPPAILDRAALLAFVKTIKPKFHPDVTIEPSADAWTFSANGTRARVPTIDAAYPDFRQIVGTGEEPVLFAVNPSYFANVLASHGSDVIRVSRANDSLSSPLFFTADDGTRHCVMPMVVTQEERPSRADAPADEQTRCPRCDFYRDLTKSGLCYQCDTEVGYPSLAPAQNVESDPAPVTPEESAFRTIRAVRERRDVKRAERKRAAHETPAPVTATDAIRCPDCGAAVDVNDRYCGECRLSLAAPNVAELDHYSAANQRRILAQCPDATDVRGFRAWMDAGRVVRKGEKGIRIHAPITANVDGASKITGIKPISVFDVSQTDQLVTAAAAA